MANVAEAASALLEAIQKEGRVERGTLVIDCKVGDRALFELLDFLARRVSIYSTNHEIKIKRANHVF